MPSNLSYLHPAGILAENVTPTGPGRSLRQAALLRILEAAHKHDLQGVVMYQPLPHLAEFHAVSCKWRLVDGGNRSSKTQSCAAETARCLLGMDPYDKYLHKCGNALVVGMELDDVARMWRTLVEPSFKMIRDEITHRWRAVRPDPNDPKHLDPYDEAYREKWKDAPPLLPESKCTVAWENVAKRIPRLVTVNTTGWKVLWRSSNGKPPQGDHYQFVHFDEQLENPQFYNEATRGMVAISEPPQYWPKGIWSATSQTANIQLYELREAADKGATHVRAFHTTIENNPYIPDQEKIEFFNSLDEDERDVRYHGIYAAATRRIYGLYDPQGMHGYDQHELPQNCSRWLFLDPGRDHCATLLVAVDPDERHAWVYDAWDMRKGNARVWAHEVARRQDGVKFEGMVIDSRAGDQNPMGFDETVAEQYRKELAALGIAPNQVGPHNGFFPGTADREAREEALVRWLEPRTDGPFKGTPTVKVQRGICPALDKQIKQAVTDPDRPNKRKRHKKYTDDLLDCLEYAAAFRPRYFTPVPAESSQDYGVYEMLQKKRAAHRARRTSL